MADLIDFDQARRFVHALGKPPGTIRLRAFFHADNPRKAGDKGRKGGAQKALVEEWQAEGRGVYIVINDDGKNGGDRDVEITTCRALFCEWDDRPKEWQLQAWRELGLPEPSIQNDTGGKSIHNYWILKEPITPAHWRLVQTRLSEYADSDRTLVNPSRVMRLPGTRHVNGKGEHGAQCTILHLSETRYSIEEFEACLPPEEERAHEQKAKVYAESEARPLHEIEEALNFIPPAVPKQGQYPKFRNLMWGLVKACIEAGSTADHAVALMQRHSPEFREAAQVGKAEGHSITAGTFWYWARHHGWRPVGQLQPLPPASSPQVVSGEGDELEAVQTQLTTKNGTEWLQLAIKVCFDYPRTPWINVDNALHRWNGTHYEHIPNENLAPGIAAFLKQLHVVEKGGSVIYPWSRPRYVDEAITWMLRQLPGATPNPPRSINCRNGVVSWEWINGKLETRFEPHSPDFTFTYTTDYDYDPAADPMNLWRLLEAVDYTDVETLQRILGSGLDLATYRAVRGRPRAVLMIGEGANGKDAIRTALRLTLGSRNFSSCTLADFKQYDQGRKFPIAPLRSASINWSSENSQFVHVDSLQALKAAISGEELMYELKGVQESEFTPSALFVFNLNKDPSLSGEQVAIETRFHVFRFSRVFISEPCKPHHVKADPRFKDDHAFIQEHICPAFLNWLLQGLGDSLQQGISYGSGKAAMESIRRNGCHLWDFCDAVGLSWAGEDSSVFLQDVWEELLKWYREEGIWDGGKWIIDGTSDPPVKLPRLLGARLRLVFPEISVERIGGQRKQTILRGLTLAR